MHRPPPLHDWAAYRATTAIGAAAIGTSLACWTKFGFESVVMDFRVWHGEPWRLVVSALPHVDPIHLIFNLGWVWVFGTLIERVLGWRALAAISLFFAAASAAAEYALFRGGVGLSGVVYGYFGLLWVLSRRDPRFADATDKQTTWLLVGWFVLCCVLTAADIWRVSNAAHAGGAVAGALLGFAMSSRGTSRWAAFVALVLFIASTFAGATIGRRYINTAKLNASEFVYFADQHVQAGRPELAIGEFKRALEIEPTNGDTWLRFGAALHKLNRYDEALDAYMQALELNPQNEQVKTTAAGVATFLGYERQKANRHEDAERLYRQALTIDNRSASAWFNLGLSCRALGKDNAAREAFQNAVTREPSNALYRQALDGSLNFNVQ